ncbi:CD83 antigen isoform X1 [Misgurnus anguillicaudatus]|uniref:CD83 antigen isoform X1 n=1 Tax=Misgurnus anguillicaudatus TaxID=75329 RepID=UPI003CCFBD3A
MRYVTQLIIWSVTLVVTEAVRHEILSVEGEDVILRCEASAKSGVQYHSVIWYKVTKEPSRLLTGLVMKRLSKINSRVEKYKGVVREIELLENSTNLFMPNVTTEDAGIYSCFLSAPLGHQNQEGEVHLKVYEDATVEALKFNNNDTIYIAALTVLGLALLIMFISYVCLRNIPQSNKKIPKQLMFTIPHQGKELITTLQSKSLICKTLPEVFV